MSSVHHDDLTLCELQPCLELLLANERDLLIERADLAAEIATRVERLTENGELLRVTRLAIARILGEAA